MSNHPTPEDEADRMSTQLLMERAGEAQAHKVLDGYMDFEGLSLPQDIMDATNDAKLGRELRQRFWAYADEKIRPLAEAGELGD